MTLLAVPVAYSLFDDLSELWARESLAGWLLDRSGPGDVEEAEQQLEQAHLLAERCGNVVFMERLADLRLRLPTTA